MSFVYTQLFVKPPYPTKSFQGQTVIVTGSNTGLGKEAARHIARLGASKLILAVRNLTAGEDAKRDIEASTKITTSTIEVWPLDLASYQSVKDFADRASKLPRIDVLLENAAVAKANLTRAEDHEQTITVNVISTTLLALLLLPKLQSTAQQFNTQPRISIVSSGAHAHAKFEEKDAPSIFAALDNVPASEFDATERYPASKLVELLAFRQIAPKLAGSGVIINHVNPGLCHSELAREGGWGLAIMKFFLARSTEVGSRTLVAGAAAGSESQGKYMSDGAVQEQGLSGFVQSQEGTKAAEKVWAELKEILEKIQRGVTGDL